MSVLLGEIFWNDFLQFHGRLQSGWFFYRSSLNMTMSGRVSQNLKRVKKRDWFWFRTLSNKVRLNISVVILHCPNKSASWFHRFCDHCVDQNEFVKNSAFFELALELALVDFFEYFLRIIFRKVSAFFLPGTARHNSWEACSLSKDTTASIFQQQSSWSFAQMSVQRHLR